MNQKEKRHKIEEREQLTESQKVMIAKKSKDRCAWCGKKVYFGYGGTVDHYIPLKKGGTNAPENLVLMCKDCNAKKHSKIIPLNIAAKYVELPYLEELGNYFENFIDTYSYLSRGNLLACDMYQVDFVPEALTNMYESAHKRGNHRRASQLCLTYALIRAYPEDEDKLVDYYAKYLTKYKLLHSKDAARENIRFWMRFGSIYYIEKNNEISVMSCIAINHNGYISIDLFAYYSNNITLNMTSGIISAISKAIMHECNLYYIPLSINFVTEDKLTNWFLRDCESAITNGVLTCILNFIYNHDYPTKDKSEDQILAEGAISFKNFMQHFNDIENQVQLYLYENDLMDMSWIADEIIGRDFFDDKYYIEFDRVLEMHKSYLNP